ncbi:CDP-diacylglycerol--glycerol-3-phosphate 3-phosphatidyltransferase [Pedobacter terrae]|uniref:CDP-diacylglycerol--glycerol-3-phosphate 3-phosphatidyltransferase n=1 Tax=Pedobacter terrae TaxID=405671 RepID=A0A1G7Y8U7_9SPHI|nr:CDP-alcohol phosphatidyltransferase family protein [Pedobacter terrae]SDG92804.1 CDP-diacylglycerol--glycerol-3-phosphate 3-phosphatidyltransferase [Pedobacter terrae]
MKHIPIALIYSRLLIGFGIILLSVFRISHYSFLAITFLSLGLLTDIFDGIIARRLNISSEKLRRLDSAIDQVFFISVAVATYIQCPDFFKANLIKLIVLGAFEVSTYVLSYIKFKKEIATHSIGAKIWTLTIFATLVEIMVHCESVVLFEICFWLGLATRLEILAIVFTLKRWTNDVPTIYHAIKLRQGKEIKRNKLFNG